MAPAGGERAVGLGHRAAAAFSGAAMVASAGWSVPVVHRALVFGIEQRGDAGAERGGGAQQIGVVRERYARPVLADAIGVLG